MSPGPGAIIAANKRAKVAAEQRDSWEVMASVLYAYLTDTNVTEGGLAVALSDFRAMKEAANARRLRS